MTHVRTLVDKLRANPRLLIPTSALLIGLVVFAIIVGPIAALFNSQGSVAPAKTHTNTFIDDSSFTSASNNPTTQHASAALGTPVNDTSSQFLASSPTTGTCTSNTIDMRVLVISADGNEVNLPAIKQALDYAGTPYTVYIATQHPGQLTNAQLTSTNCHGRFQGVILTTGVLAYTPDGVNWQSALSQPEWDALYAYEATYGVRQVSWYTYPNADLGFQSPTAGSAATVNGIYTADAAAVFPYVNTKGTLPIQYAWNYRAKPLTDGLTKPLIVDGSGNALAAIRSYPNGRQNLALTFDSNQYMLHDLILSYGLVGWVTKGIYIGDRHSYLLAQVDDVLLDDDIWTPTTPCGTSVDATTQTYRITGNDLNAVASWQRSTNTQSVTQALRLDMVFNGYGAAKGAYSNDTLTSSVRNNQRQFFWTDHTWDHENLDAMSYADASAELSQNIKMARTLGLSNFNSNYMVTPDISGLTNPNFMKAAYDNGIRYLVSDTSKPGYSNPSPNTGIYNPLQPQILMIPRHPTNLFFNVSTPDEWVAEYNCLYKAFWGKNLSYSEVLDQESQSMLYYLLKGDIDPAMFHQPNLRAYDGRHTLLGDLIDRTVAKYSQYFTAPIQSIREDSVGVKMAQRMQFNAAGVTASIVPGKSVTFTATQKTTFPVTGLALSGSETYGGQSISYISLNAGQSLTYPYSGN